MTTPPDQPPPYGQGFPPPQQPGQPPQPGWGQPSSPQGFPAQPGYQPMPGHQFPPPQFPPPQFPPPQFPPPQFPSPQFQQPQYGQPQYGQNQYPQPGPPPPPQDFQGRQFQGYPQGQQFPPPPPTGGTSRGAKALIGVVVLGIIGIVIAGVISGATGPAGAEAGECIKVNSAGVSDADVDKVDCSSSEAAFKVAANLDSSTDTCPSGDYAEYSDRGGRRSDGFKLCLALNAKQGDCFKREGTFVAGKITKVTCDSNATDKVTKVVDGRTDENECESGDTVFVYSQPATTLCLSKL